MNETTSKSSLPLGHRSLIELMQRLNFSRIEDLIIRGGKPIFDPAPKVIQKMKIGGENGPRLELESEDFLLKKQTIELLDTIARLQNGVVLEIEVKHGLPFCIEVELQKLQGGIAAGGRRD